MGHSFVHSPIYPTSRQTTPVESRVSKIGKKVKGHEHPFIDREREKYRGQRLSQNGPPSMP